MYTPSERILKNYADVLVNFALGGGKGIKKGEVVRVSASESAKPLFLAVHNAIVDAGGHMLSHYAPDDEQGDKRRNESFTRYFYEHAQPHQIAYFSEEVSERRCARNGPLAFHSRRERPRMRLKALTRRKLCREALR